MKKFRHPRRSVILMFLLGILTIGIYPLVVFCHIGKEINQITEGKEGYKRSMHFLGAFFLGFITLGIVPIVWVCRVASKFGRVAYELEIRKPHISGTSAFLLNVLFAVFVIPAIVGCFKFIHTVNAVESRLNAIAEEESIADAESDIIVPEEGEEDPKGVSCDKCAIAEDEPDQVEEEPAAEVDETQEPDEAAEETAQVEAPASEEEAERPPFEYVTQNPLPEPDRNAPRSDIAAIYHVAGREEPRKWQVRLPDSDVPVKVFDTKEEAIAYAKGLGARRHATVRVKN